MQYLASLAAGYRPTTDHPDVVTAFLNPQADPEPYMETPNGWDSGWDGGSGGSSGNGDSGRSGSDGGNGDSNDSSSNGGDGITAGMIERLKKALYGLKQAPRLWYRGIGGIAATEGLDSTKRVTMDQLHLTEIYTDSQGALAHITTGISKARTKYIEVCYYYNRDLHQRKVVKCDCVRTDDNPADILTKRGKKGRRSKHTSGRRASPI